MKWSNKKKYTHKIKKIKLSHKMTYKFLNTMNIPTKRTTLSRRRINLWSKKIINNYRTLSINMRN